MPSCGKSMFAGRKITRKAYITHRRGKTIRVHSRRIHDVGTPGKYHGPGIGPLKKGQLGKLGYSSTSSKTARHSSLKKAVKKFGPLSTFRKLNAVGTYTKRTSKIKSKRFIADRDWVKKTYM